MNKLKLIKKLKYWYEMIILDHGFLRLLYHNFHKIDDNMYRSNMPTPSRIKKYKKIGIKTIINLRGGRNGGYYLEKEACIENKLKFINFIARSRAAPEIKMINDLNSIFNKIDFPVLIHCKSGADRAGIIAALYKILYKKESVKIAKKQLSIKYLHIKWAKTGILGKFFDQYEDFCKKNNNVNFLYWVNNYYNPKYLEKANKSNKFLDIIFKILGRE